jgi:hypothetical protein
MRAAATTAVVAGTAGAVSHRQQQRYAAKDQAAYDQQNAAAQSDQQAADMQAMQAQLDAMQAQQPAAAAAPAAAPAGNDMMAQLEQLSQLKNAGVLDDAEFAAAKAKLLGI